MEQERIRHEDHPGFKHACARAGAWGLLLLGLLAVCASLPLVALSL